MPRTVRKRVPPIAGASCLVAACALTAGGASAAAWTSGCPSASARETGPAASAETARNTGIVMPALGGTSEEGTVLWHAKLGAKVSEGDWLADVTTDEAERRVDAPVDGVLIDICVGENDRARAGDPLGVIGPPGSAPAGAG
ncbi:lipoyl domain-containing protein [Streptomyces sp. NPDC012751]|uniref:lipoyl domain-containing protein n=1 Tax=Streptomyces sp. NPDC012751 TaxID=3364846 RepID=UPI0036B0C872